MLSAAQCTIKAGAVFAFLKVHLEPAIIGVGNAFHIAARD
jgi:hypothetical protein